MRPLIGLFLAISCAAASDAAELRTRHLDAEGKPKYTNRLALSASPYLQQHAHNPVNWYPWGDEAFAAAKALGRPVFLSIGYSTCHWCHVMEEESFEDEEIARVLNENYVAIKVDREERPDVDAIYMSAAQALTGGGGWPLNVFLTPERKPFYAGTYYPARDGDRGKGAGFLTLLRKIREVYAGRPDEVRQASDSLAEQIRTSMEVSAADAASPGAEVLHLAAQQSTARFDADNGGTRGQPKFPSALPLRFLLRYARRMGDPAPAQMAATTLEKMAAGGLYDQVGGGFHRYSTDARWLVPHFEKMLYDNALLVVAYLEAYQVTGREDFARIARETLRYVERDMTSPEGAFYSATDADSAAPNGKREEGWFFTWTPAEIEAVLGAERGRELTAVYAVTAAGNFDGRNILSLPLPLDQVAANRAVSPQELRARVDDGRERLYHARQQRPAPLRDEKILAAWNGLMISAFAQASLVLAEPSYAQRAERAAGFVLGRMRPDGRLRRSFKDGAAHHAAYLEDYAFMIAALLDLYEATGKVSWLDEAVSLDRTVEQHYEDAANGGFYRTADDGEALLAREKPIADGAEPSGNAVQILNLLRLHDLAGDERYRRRAERALRAFGGTLRRSPASLSETLLALDYALDSPKEIVIVTPASREDATPFLDKLRRTHLPNRTLSVVDAATAATHAQRVPLVADKIARNGKATAYVCENRVCALPTSDAAVFAEQLRLRRDAPPP